MDTQAKKSGRAQGSRRLLRWGDAVVMAVVLLLAGMSFFILYIRAEPGRTAVVTTPSGSFVLSLEEDTLRELEGEGGIRVVIRVAEGRVRFEESGCPDKICVHTGWLSRAGQSAACLPAGIILRVEGREEDGLDYFVN